MSLKNSEQLENLYNRKPYLKMYRLEQSPESSTFLKKAKVSGEFFLEKNGKPFASIISPGKQAERSIQEKKIKNHHLILVMGLGNPHLPLLLNRNLRQGQILLLIDDSPDSIPPLWEPYLFQILDIPGRHLFAGENSIPLLLNYIESLPIDKLTGVLFFRNQTNVQNQPDYYLPLEERISKLFSSKMSDLLTKFEFERIWVKNTISTILSYSDSKCKRVRISEIENTIHGIPGVLVSAGPSLREQCELIKEIRDKIFLFSCDTSLKVLLKFGLIPDGVMTLDAQTHSFFHFMGENLNGIPLFADVVVYPQLLRSMKFKSIVHSQTAKYQVDAAGNPIRESTAGSDLVEYSIGAQGDIQSGGSVATSAFDVLRFLGIKEIYLVGQDLAYTGREIHSTGTHHNEKWLTQLNRKQSLEKINEIIVRKRKTKYIPASDGGEVLTDYVLEIYKHWFEESALSVDIKIKNISSGGAKIQNIESISISDAKYIFQNKPTHSYPWRVYSPWNSDFKPHNQQTGLAKKILNDLKELETSLQVISNSPDFARDIEIILDGIKTKPYLLNMLRKTRIYMLRHEGELGGEREKNLLISSIKKELRYLKKTILNYEF